MDGRQWYTVASRSSTHGSATCTNIDLRIWCLHAGPRPASKWVYTWSCEWSVVLFSHATTDLPCEWLWVLFNVPLPMIWQTERRPIIFVAHSLGGIILKSVRKSHYTNGVSYWLFHQALLLANLCGEHHNFHHKSIELSTYGLIFLGTPHQGAENINFALLLLHIQAIYTPTTDIIVKDIELHSKVLQEQLDRYKAISHKYATIFCYEKYPTKLFIGKRVKVRHSLLKTLLVMTHI